jgi:hypothetical protein
MDMTDGGIAGGIGMLALVELLLWFGVIAAVAALGIYVTMKLFPRREAEQAGKGVEGALGPTQEGHREAPPEEETMRGTAVDRRPVADDKGDDKRGDRGRKAA